MALQVQPAYDVKQGFSFGANYNPEDDSYSFAIWSPKAKAIRLHFYTPAEEKLGVCQLNNRKGGVWYGKVCGLKPGDLYALEALGEYKPEEGLYFKEGHFLVDPFAVQLNKPFVYSDELYHDFNEDFIPKAVLQGPDTFDWQGSSRVFISRSHTILYEAHVRGMTMRHPEVPEKLRGTYLGMCTPPVIAHLKKLGVTVVQLMPVAASMSEPGLVRRGLVNYWGYNPVCFMAPDPRFASNPADSLNEFKTMVRELHKNGIGVILDVVYNHTAEGGNDGPVLSFKGLDARHYYAYAKDGNGTLQYQQFLNYTGCGNSFNTDENIGLLMVHNTLLHWSKELQVDGFRFDLAVTVARESHDCGPHFAFDRNAAFFKSCMASRALNSLLYIAEPWDVGPDGYRVGQFPMGWSEQNDHFRDTIRRFWRGDPGLTGEFATRIMGSRDLFHKGVRSMNASVNYITYHDGFTLEDLVSYSTKHNELNGEDNRDGSPENFSTNCGFEGPTDDKAVQERRWQLKRNLMATLVLSQGVPHILAGDEMSHTQNGNNNAFCQDNDLSYLQWQMTPQNRQFIEFISRINSIRKSSGVLRELALDDDNFYQKEDTTLVRWRKSDGHLMEDYDWNNSELKSFLLYIGERDIKGERWCIIFNWGDRDNIFRLPEIGSTRQWKAVLDTSEPDGVPRRFTEESATAGVVAARSIKILRSADNTEHLSTTIDTEDISMRHQGRMDRLYGHHS